MNYQKKDIKKVIPFIITSKRILKSKIKFNQGDEASVHWKLSDTDKRN